MAKANFFNSGEHIARIIRDTICNKHDAGKGDPCYVVPSDSGPDRNIGVCGPRITRAGYNGKISSMSMRTRAPSRRR